MTMITSQTDSVDSISSETIDQLRAGFRGHLIQPGDPEYAEARLVFNGLIDRQPALIARCHGTADVVAAVNFAREQGLVVSVRGGGHNVAGNAVNDGGIVIDLSAMRAVVVDPEKKTVRAQGGATWGDFDRETQLFGLATTGGQVSTTGIAGLTLHGGLGVLHRTFGLALDNLLSVEIVTADGQVRTASESTNPDLVWGVRGAGSNFGVVTSFEYRLHPLGPEVYMAVPCFALDDAAGILRTYRDYSDSAPDAVNPQAIFLDVPPIEDFPAELHNKALVAMQFMYAGDPDEGAEALKHVFEWGEPVLDLSGRLPYADSQMAFDFFFPQGYNYYWKSHLLKGLSDEAIDAIVDLGRTRPSAQAMINVWPLGGAVSRVDPNATAWNHRDAGWMLSLDTTWTDPADSERCIAWTREAWTRMQQHGQVGVYLNFAGLRGEKEDLVRAGYGSHYERLVELKTTYDPDNLFRMNQNIPPVEAAAAD
jgi:FAD/FMN-containing dehydrogenase